MINLSDYEGWKAKQQQQSVAAANAVLVNAAEQNPDEVAGNLTLADEFAKTTGNPRPPTPLVAEYKNTFQALIEQKKNETILSSAPQLTEWLRNPANAVLAVDDVANLGWFEGAWQGYKNLDVRATERVKQMGNQLVLETTAQRAKDRKLTFGEILDDARIDRSGITDTSGAPVRTNDGSEYLSAIGRWVDARFADFYNLDDDAKSKEAANALAKNLERMAAAPKSYLAQTFEKEAQVKDVTFGEAIKNYTGAALKNPVGFLTWAIETGGESAPQLAATLAAGALGGPVAAARMTFATSGLTERYTSPAEYFKEKGFDLSKPEDVQRMLADPDVLRDAAQRGVIRGIVVGAFDALSVGIAGKAMVSNPIAEFVAQGLTQAALGGGGEYFARLAAGQAIDWNDILAEAFAELATAPVESVAAGRKFIRDRQSVKDAEERATVVDQLDAQTAASKLKLRHPDTFRDFVATATEGTPTQNLFVPAQEFVTYFQGLGVDPYALADSLEGVSRDDLTAAIAAGDDLQIPTATYAAKISGTEYAPFFKENAKFSPGEMSLREAADFKAREPQILDETWKAAQETQRRDMLDNAGFEDVRAEMSARFRAAGRSAEVANTEALTFAAFYRTMAQRVGQTVDDFMRAYPLPVVQGAIPQGMQFRDVDALNRTLAEARAAKPKGDKRQGLLDFIANYGGVIDLGGELKARDAETLHQPGKKKLRLSRDATAPGEKGKGYGPDDVARAAIDAGFMADVPAVAEYKQAVLDGRETPDIVRAFWDAVDAELRGRADGADANPAAVPVEEYLARLGLTLNDSDAVIKEAIRKDQEASRQYNQVSPAQARAIDMAVALPLDPIFAEAVRNTKGAEETLDGLLIDLVRFQKPEQEGATSVRTGVFYLPVGSKDAKHYKSGGKKADGWYGGQIKVEGKTLIKRPLFVKGATGGRAPEAAFDALKGKGAAEKLRGDILRAMGGGALGRKGSLLEESVGNLLRVYGADEVMAYEIIENSQAGNQLRFALQENIIAHATREAGYDAVVGYSKGKAGPFISEVFDVREIDYPVPGEDAVLHPAFEGRRYYQRKEAIRKSQAGQTEFGYAQTEFGQRMDRGPRGLLALPAGGIGNGDTVIRLFETADLSTVIHESGHYFLSVMQDIAAKGEQNAATDLATINAWWRENAAAVAKDGQKVTGTAITEADVQAVLDNGTTGDMAKDAAVDVGQQEQFARAFEAYLMEGKAPSADLRSAFEKFRAWLIAVYRSLVNLNVKVSDDIRSVMDRMIATDEEIAKAKEDAGDGAPIFATAEQMGLTQDEFDGILKMRAQAEDEAKARLLQETMEPIRRERERAYKEAKAEVLAEVEKEVNSLYVYRALEWMGNRRWLGDGQPEAMADFRLSKDILVERYGEGVLKTLPRGKQTIYAVEGGVDPDLAADLFGFGSGDEMIRALERATPRQEAIKAELDKAMAERYPDPLTDGDIEAKALDAVHVDKRGMWIAAELKAVTEVAGRDGVMTMKQARVAARQTIARMKVRDAVNAGRFLAAERRAATEAANLAGMLGREGVWMNNARRRIATKARAAMNENATVEAVAGQIDQANRSTGNYNETVAALIDAKRKQLLNHALYMEARKVADEVQKGENFVGRLNKATTRERIAGAGRRDNAQIDYLAAIDEILERYDFRKMSGTAEERRGSLMDFVEAMKAAGRENELNIPESVMRQAARAPYKTLPVEQFRGVIDSLKNLEHVASRWDALIDAQNKRSLDSQVDAVVSSIEKNMPKRPPGPVATSGEDRRGGIRKYLNLARNATSIALSMDGEQELGPAYQAIVLPVIEAEHRLILRKQAAAAEVNALFQTYSKSDKRRMNVREHVPALGYALSKWERIAVALNTGNAINRERLTNPNSPRPMTEAQIGAVLATLDERDAIFVQKVWDYIGSFKADIAARERRVKGTEPEWTEPQAVMIAGRQLKGGYYPIKYDSRLSWGQEDQDFNEQINALQAGQFVTAQTRQGHLKARTATTSKAISLDIMEVHGHVNQVIYDLEMNEPVVNVSRILRDGRTREAFRDAGMRPEYEALEIWTQDVGAGQLHAADQVSRIARAAKSNFTLAALGVNLSSALSQVSGVAQSIAVLGPKDFAVGVQQMFRPGIRDEIKAKSPFMSTRESSFNKEAYDFAVDPKRSTASSVLGDFKRDVFAPAVMLAMSKLQWTVDVPTWLGGYNQGLRKFGNDEAQAIAYANLAVERAQGGGLFSMQSGIERGSTSRSTRQSSALRLFSTLASYQYAKYRLAYHTIAKSGRVIQDEGLSIEAAQEVVSATVKLAMIFMVDAVIMAAIKGKLPDEDDEKNKSWMKFLAKETSFGMMGTLPFVRDIIPFFEGYGGGGMYGSVLQKVADPIRQVWQGEFDKALVKSFVSAAGLFTGAPSVFLNRILDAGWRQYEGEDVSVVEYALGKRKK